MQLKKPSGGACFAILIGLTCAFSAIAQITVFEHKDFRGRSLSSEAPVVNFDKRGFNDRVSSLEVRGDRWQVCEHAKFRGRCLIFRPGRYPDMSALGMNDQISSARPIDRNARVDERLYAPLPRGRQDDQEGQITFYEHDGFGGRSFSADESVLNFSRLGFNDRASSVAVMGGRWLVCEHAAYQGRCVVLRRGRYPSLGSIGLNDTLSSARPLDEDGRDDRRHEPVLVPDQTPYHRARQERLYEADVVAVRAVLGPPEKRCWIERENVVQERDSGLPETVVGAVIGGILGHQVGKGDGQTLATVGGAVAGAVVGNAIGRDSDEDEVRTRDVERCVTDQHREKPEFWDVSYVFRGVEHRLQMTSPPGRTITVNEYGEPRI